MEIFENNKGGRKIVVTDNFERMLNKNVNCNMHSYVRYRIAKLFRKEIFAKLFENMASRNYMTPELIARRIELTRDMMGEIRRDYGTRPVKYLTQFL